MKNKILLLIGLLLFLSGSLISCRRDKAQDIIPESSITIFCTPDLDELTNSWADVFCKLNPDVKIEVISVTRSSIAESLDNNRNLGLISGEYDNTVDGNSIWKVAVGRDVTVPVINANNPFLNEISRQGVTSERLAQLINDPGKTSWGTLLQSGRNAPVNLYVIDDASVHSGMVGLLNSDQTDVSGTIVGDGEDLISAIKNDIYSVGICKITSVMDFDNQGIHEEVKLLPIDRNSNGVLDFKERIYDDLDAFLRGVWIGKYPRALFNNIYSISTAQPTNKYELAFIKWILIDGQVLLDNYGFSDLEHSEKLAKAKLINNYGTNTPNSGDYGIPKEPLFSNIFFLALLTLIIITGFLSISGLIISRNEKGVITEITAPRPAFNEDFVKSPQGLYYDKTHTWAFMEEDGMVKIGIDDFLQHVTGPLTRVRMKNPGERIRKGKQVLSIIQDGKQLDIYAPVSGTIKEQNEILNTDTSIINSSPYSKGWIYKIEPTNWFKEMQFLITGSKYREWLKSEFSRLKEFLTNSDRPESVEYVYVLQDGGELQNRILEDLGPEIWDDFQTNFIDVAS